MDGRALVARNLRKLRVVRGISQEQLAAEAEIDRAYLGGIERRTENPTVDLLDRIAATLSVSLGELFVSPDPSEDPPAPLKGGRKKQRKV